MAWLGLYISCPCVIVLWSFFIVNIIELSATAIQVGGTLAVKPGLVHLFQNKKMPVTSQQHDNCFSFV